MAALIVSAYFKIPSKASHAFYMEHMKRFLGNVTTMVVFFTTPDLVKSVTNMRGNKPIMICTVDSIMDLVAMKKYGYDFWRTQCNRDPEKYHTPEVAAVWYEKKEFVKRACAARPDHTGPFVWCDTGCVRTDAWLPSLRTFGQNVGSDVVPKDKLLMQLLKPLPTALSAPATHFFRHPDCYIAGALIAGYRDTWYACSELYDNTLGIYNTNEVCANSDQYVWASTILRYPERFQTVLAETVANTPDKWFVFLKYLS